MEDLIAVPYEEDKYNLVSLEGIVYLRVNTKNKRFVDHDLLVKELSEAPSDMSVVVREILDEMIGRDKWRVISRIPGNAILSIENKVDMKNHPSALELRLEEETNRVIRTPLND